MGAKVPNPSSVLKVRLVLLSYSVGAISLMFNRRPVGEVGSNRVAWSLGNGISGKGVAVKS